MTRIALLLLTCTGLAACSYVSAPGLARLSALSPLEADPADIAVAIDLPSGLGTVPSSTILTLQANRTDTGESFEETFVLRTRRAGDLDVFAVAETDLDRLRAAQREARLWEDAAPQASQGSLSVSAEFCTTGRGPAPDARSSILIQTSPTGAFFPLVRNAPVREAADPEALRALPPC